MSRGLVLGLLAASAVIAVAAVLTSTRAFAGAAIQTAPAEIHCEHFRAGMPLGAPPSSDLIFRDLYALSSNDDTKIADWVCYRLTPQEVAGTLPLDRDWFADPFLDPSETLEPSRPVDDYKDADKAPTEYDRGHLAPLASFKGSLSAREVNSYANIVPMKKALNRGPWAALEDAVRALVLREGEVWVACGPLYERDMPRLPRCDEEHTVPSGFWQVVAVRADGGLRAAAFVMDQSESGSDYERFLVSVDDVEARSGLNLFAEVPAAQEAALESAAATSWVRSW